MDGDMKIEKRDPMAKARAAKAAKRAAGVAPEPQPQAIDDNVELGQSHNQPIHEPNRTPIRGGGRMEVTGRNGEILSRRRTGTGDIFDVPADLIPKGWAYQWCAISIVGNTEILMDQNLMFQENGWRPVPASRYPGRYMPAGHQGSIIRGQQMLMERPEALVAEAKAEDVRLARQLISDRNDSLKLSGMKKNLGDGFEMGDKYRGTGGDIRMSIDKALDAPAPKHTLADPGE